MNDNYYNAPGAAAGDAMQTFMMQQQAMKHQQLLDSLAVQREGRLANADNLDMEMRRLMLEEKKQEAAEKIKDKARQAHLQELGTMVPGDIPSSKMIADAKEFGTEHLIKDPKQGLRDFAKTLPADSPESAGVQQQLTGPVRIFAGLPAQRQAADAKAQQEQYINSLPQGPLKDAAMFRMRTGSTEPAGVIKAENPPPPKPETKPIYGMGKGGKIEQLGEMPANAILRNEPVVADHSAADATRQATEAAKVQATREHAYSEFKESAKSISDQMTSIDHLQDALASNSPAADGLIVPMLLKGTIAGGGVRITQNEIDQVLKARNSYDSMKISLNHWLNTAPDAQGNKPPLVLTSDQKLAISDIATRLKNRATAVHNRLVEARKSIDAAKDINSINNARTAFEVNRYNEPDDTTTAAPVTLPPGVTVKMKTKP